MIKNPFADYPGYLLRHASNANLNAIYDRLRPLDLRLAEASVLLLIQANPGVTQSEACQTLGIARANMAPLVNRLESKDLVSRTPVDGRSYGLTVSPQGKEVAKRADAELKAQEKELLDAVPKELRQSFVEALGYIAAFNAAEQTE